MIPIDTVSALEFSSKISEPSSPAKPNYPVINFYDLLNSKNLSGSSLSTNDDVSTRNDDDTTKSLLSFESINIKLPKEKKSKKKIPENLQTLKQIVSKRGDSKIIGCINDIDPKEKGSNNKKRMANPEPVESEDQTLKKRMLEGEGQIKPLSIQPEDGIAVPRIIFRDGRAQVENPNIKNERVEDVTKQALPVVTFQQRRVTSNSFKKSNQAEKWAVRETRKFYRGLEIFGTDFSMITKLFRNRNRNQIKNKFLKEEKINPEKIEATFKKNKTINFSNLKKRLERKAGKIPSRKVSVEGIIERSERSGSFHSVTSLDSIDMSIMEDLAEAFVPTKQLALLSNFGEQRLLKAEANLV